MIGKNKNKKITPTALAVTYMVLTVIGILSFFLAPYTGIFLHYGLGANSIILSFIVAGATAFGDGVADLFTRVSALWMPIFLVILVVVFLIALIKKNYRPFSVTCVLNSIGTFAILLYIVITAGDWDGVWGYLGIFAGAVISLGFAFAIDRLSKGNGIVPKPSHKVSVTISMIITCALFFVFAGLAIFLPTLLEKYITFFEKPQIYFPPTLTLFYVGLIPAFVADASLYLLLRNVNKEDIFENSNINYLRILSWCCFAECVVFLLLGMYYHTSLLISFAALFMGIILRVVKNVIEAAVEIKSENDYTI